MSTKALVIACLVGVVAGLLILSTDAELGLVEAELRPLGEGDALLPGDILVTRNAGGERPDNRSPGWWNHCAIMGHCGKVVEAQEGQGVIAVETAEFLRRYPRIRVYRARQEAFGPAMAQRAAELVGCDYWRLSSIFRHARDEERGMNCVSVVRDCWRVVAGYDPRWHRPDDVAGDPRLKLVMEKR